MRMDIFNIKNIEIEREKIKGEKGVFEVMRFIFKNEEDKKDFSLTVYYSEGIAIREIQK
jgi:hypothetical protein